MRYFVWLTRKNEPVGDPHHISEGIDWNKRPEGATGGVAVGSHLYLIHSYGINKKKFEKWEVKRRKSEIE